LIKLPGKLTNNSRVWYALDSCTIASLSSTDNKSTNKISGSDI